MAPFNARAPFSRTLADLAFELAERHGDELAVISGQRSVTYRELRDRAMRAAGALKSAGIRRGDRVGLLLPNELEWIDVCLGAAILGAGVVPFSTWSKQRELDFVLRDSRVRALITASRLADQDYAADLRALIPALEHENPGRWRAPAYPMLERIAFVDDAFLLGADRWDQWLADSTAVASLPPPGEGANSNEPALILYTSGSSANPKAVPLLHGAMIENGFNIGERQGLAPGEPVLLTSPLFWSYGSANALVATFTHGATLVLQPRFEAAAALDLIERHRCRAIYTLPSITAALLAEPSFSRERTRSLRTGLTIGTAQEVATAANVLGASEICNIYGQTESYGNCAVTWHHWPLERRQRVQGPPLPGVTVRIMGPDDGKPRAPGEIGSIEVRGRVTPGYDGSSAEHNATAFTADGFFRTGDLGLLTADGDVQFMGRDTEMIKRAGINIAPAEIEDVLQRHPAVLRVGVAGAPDPARGEIIVAFVVPVAGSAITADDLRAYCRANAASYKTPDIVELCASLPATATGKLLRRELKRVASTLVTGTAP